MSKCWYCNEEITTGNNPEHLGICDKCYNEMFECGNEFIRNMVNKISDLEAKLAEMTEKYNACQEARKLEIEFNKQDKAELKQKLAEKEKEIEDMKFMMRNTEQALNNVPNAMAGQRKRIDELTKELKQANQDKISFAVDNLTEVKKQLRQDVNITAPISELKKLKDYLIGVDEFIDNQIKQLKEMRSKHG